MRVTVKIEALVMSIDSCLSYSRPHLAITLLIWSHSQRVNSAVQAMTNDRCFLSKIHVSKRQSREGPVWKPQANSGIYCIDSLGKQKVGDLDK
jgi:hypothetical protein